jgi:hypothetical protein
MATGFDIKAQVEKAKKEDEGIDVHVNGVDEQPLYYQKEEEMHPVTIRMAGVHSALFRRAEERIRKRKLKPRQFTGELIYEDNIEKVAACALGWDGFYSNGQEVPFTQENIKEIFKQCPWVLDQCMEAMNDHASFFENGSKPE